jgi:hypothetical protein
LGSDGKIINALPNVVVKWLHVLSDL